MSDRIELSSSFTHLFNKSRHAAAYDEMEHTLSAHRTPLGNVSLIRRHEVISASNAHHERYDRLSGKRMAAFALLADKQLWVGTSTGRKSLCCLVSSIVQFKTRKICFISVNSCDQNGIVW